MDKLTAMNVFCSVVEMQSFSGAARKLGISTTATSRHVQMLEQQLNAILLHRSTRHLTVTPCGYEYYEHCCEILEKVQHAESDIISQSASVGGVITVNLPYTFGQRFIASMLLQFHRQHPKIVLDIEYSNQPVDLVQGGIDVAVRISRSLPPGLVARELACVRLVCCASPGYLQDNGIPLHPIDLRNHTCLAYSYAGFRNLWQFSKGDEVFSVNAGGGLRANSGEMLKTAACCGAGITLLPEFHVDAALRNGGLVRLLTDFATEIYTVSAVYRPNSRKIKRVKLLVDHLHSAFPGNTLIIP